MSHHHHTIVFDRDDNLPAFAEHLHELLVYVATNPVQVRLVDKVHHWPGVNGLAAPVLLAPISINPGPDPPGPARRARRILHRGSRRS